ncbi:hypothetical protein IAG44_39035 [Streptomyces roseirectus]|uniref:DUF6603 domain-containing protein n=1 Tax=Streptomyces roseirectus TaxID=2768066 RepID=A0A7H0IPZ1_9ACTN|nr:DUF6603 domain-containing protein [Streptomyces roseirectus]QNP74857.1 hypothetical protein IAG44_39035 [Streptomyces roseirectus]
MDLDALKAHLTDLTQPPALRTTDTALPTPLTDMLATFPNGTCQGAAGSGTAEIDGGHTTLTLALTCSSTPWPAGGRVTLAVTGVTVTVTADGTVSLILSGALDVTDVVATVTDGGDGRLTAEVRPRKPGAFTGELDKLGGLLGDASLWQSAREGLHAFDFAARDVAGFDYRLSRKDGVEPAAYDVTSMAIVAALDLRGLALDIALWLPDLTVEGTLHDGKPLNARSLLGSFGIPVAEIPPSLTISELRVDALLGDGYFVSMTVRDGWDIGPFALTELSLSLYYDPASKFVAMASGTISLGHSMDITVSAAQNGGATGGWAFSGGLAAGEIGIGDVIGALRLPDVPEPLKSLELTSLWLSYTTGTKAVDFLCQGRMTIAEGITASLGLTITRDGTATRYGGQLAVDDFTFDITLDDEKTGTDLLIATYHGPENTDTKVTLRDWVAHFSADLAADIPESLHVELKDAKFVRVKPQGGPAQFCVGIDLSAGIDLAELPLVGGFLAEIGGSLAVDNLQVLYSSGVIAPAAVGSANALLAKARVVELPAGGLKAGPAALADLRIGQERTPVALGLPASPTPTGSTPSTPNTPSTPAQTNTPTTTPPRSSAGVWITVQKTIGVVQINRVGVIYQHNTLLFGLDAGIQLGPLVMSLDGLAVGSSLEKFAPAFRLDGVGIGYVAPPIEIEGALLHLPDDQLDKGVAFQYDGTATVAVPDFSLAAVGSYAQLTNGQPSLFVFAQVEAPIVAAPPILITGLMAGFGFNRELTLPTPREVSGFPLLALNKQGPDANLKPSGMLEVLEGRTPAVVGSPARKWIAPRQGAYWLALGIEFSVAEVVNSKVLLAAEFGDELALAVLGIATLQLPMPAESATRTYVYAELGLEAVIRPLAGSFELAAELAPVSYVLTPECHLTGGFAASVWFGSHPNAGQFVVTLGGYHPSFQQPAGYPDVPRLGINWAVSGNLTITAQAYLAVTPSCAMAGGRLSVVFHEGDFRAWFTAQADVLLSWRPFFFTARISVSIGASYTLNVWIVHKTFSVTVGADLELWGPPTGGSVTAHFVGFSKTIGFGPGPSGADAEALDWDGFASMLPKPADVITIGPVSGLDKTAEDTGDDPGNSGKVWYVRARDLRFFTQSAVPASHLRLGDDPLSSPAAEDTPGVDVRPMNRTGLTGEHRLRLYFEGAPAPMDGWSATARTHNLPASLWGAPPSPFSHTPHAPGAEVLPGRPVGYDVQAPRPELAGSRGVFPLSDYSADEIPPGLAPLSSSPVADRDYVSVADDSCVARIGQTDRGPARTGRDQVCAALADAGLFKDPCDGLTALAAGAAHLYHRAPLVQNPG